MRHWRFKPGTRDGEPVAVNMKVRVSFRFFGENPAAAPQAPHGASASAAQGRIVRSVDVADRLPRGSGPGVPLQAIKDRVGANGLAIMGAYDQKRAAYMKTAIQQLYAARGVTARVYETIRLIPPHSVAVTFVVTKQ